uniref:Uncharacterized protein n=1 Tax=Anguilla anguilla TaxID=7936 RepID=A0A0E9UJS4_ANGAN
MHKKGQIYTLAHYSTQKTLFSVYLQFMIFQGPGLAYLLNNLGHSFD